MNEKKPVIKIFVSHRIDQQNEIIQDEVFTPIRCGACFDQRDTKFQQEIEGDDSGDNISDKRYKFNEMTVLYWAWKNSNADYIGLCHYRRYFSFNISEQYPKNINQLVEEYGLTESTKKKYKINQAAVYKLIEDYPKVDIYLPEIFDISQIFHNKKFSNRMRHENVCGKKFADDSINLLLDVIRLESPEFLDDAINYYNGCYAYFCDTFIMKRSMLNEYCEWVFKILFEVENRIDYENLSMNATRIAAFFSEDLLSIFVFNKLSKKSIKKKELQLVFFTNPVKYNVTNPIFEEKTAIVITSSNEYVPYIGVLINSIMTNSHSYQSYDIVILQTDIKREYKELLQLMIIGKNNFSIRFVDVSNEIHDYVFNVGNYQIQTFYRLLIPYLFCQYEKAIYLDADMIVNTDISELYGINLDDNFIAAVPDIRYMGWNNIEGNWTNEYNDKILNCDFRNEKYFNAGLIIFNIPVFLDNIPQDTILSLATENTWRFVDQDVLNILCYGHVEYLPITWNVMVSGDNFDTEKNAPLFFYNEYKKAHNNPKIIHYAGNLMPVMHPETDLWWFYWKYARSSIFYELILARINVGFTVGLNDKRTELRKIIDTLLPLNSKRREKIAKLIHALRRNNRYFEHVFLKLCLK